MKTIQTFMPTPSFGEPADSIKRPSEIITVIIDGPPERVRDLSRFIKKHVEAYEGPKLVEI